MCHIQNVESLAFAAEKLLENMDSSKEQEQQQRKQGFVGLGHGRARDRLAH